MAPTDEALSLARLMDMAPHHVARTIELLDEGNTIWFIARYRKEQTGEMDEERLQQLAESVKARRALRERQEEVLRLLASQDALTPQLQAAIVEAQSLQRVDDLYRPFRPKRTTRAGIARDKGLEPLAKVM